MAEDGLHLHVYGHVLGTGRRRCVDRRTSCLAKSRMHRAKTKGTIWTSRPKRHHVRYSLSLHQAPKLICRHTAAKGYTILKAVHRSQKNGGYPRRQISLERKFPSHACFSKHQQIVEHLKIFPGFHQIKTVHCNRFLFADSVGPSSSPSLSAVSAGLSSECTLLAILLLRVGGPVSSPLKKDRALGICQPASLGLA